MCLAAISPIIVDISIIRKVTICSFILAEKGYKAGFSAGSFGCKIGKSGVAQAQAWNWEIVSSRRQQIFQNLPPRGEGSKKGQPKGWPFFFYWVIVSNHCQQAFTDSGVGHGPCVMI
ncbi:MAG: hypothetical protein L6461_03805 [Anaerolineae bacterium]|nr:hypothetical protein [Anaerolineae bacterium]